MKTISDYNNIIEEIIKEAREIEDVRDRDRYIQESVSSSEWTFKPVLEKIVLCETGHIFNTAYETMLNDVLSEV